MEIFSLFAAEAALPTLFLLSFLAATLLPIGSEWLLALLILQGHSPVLVVVIAGCGNVLGAFTTYLIGLYGSEIVTQRMLRIDARQLQRATRLYHRYGAWSLLLSWVPIIGDPLCLLAGIFKVSLARFSLPVIIGKFSRYGLVAAMLPTTGGGV